jgi:N-acetylmuramoyl-L-alanine amidase
MPDYTVGSGESIASIAKQQGFLWKTIWEHGNNSGLRAKRKDPNQLAPGDKLFIPDKGKKTVSKPVDARHSFKRKGEPTKLKLRLTTMDEPRAKESYTLVFGDQVIHGVTDGDGKLEHPIPGETQSATLTLSGGDEVYAIAIGGLLPVTDTAGVQRRLQNLGFDCGGEDGTVGDATRDALKRFQAQYKLQVTGEPDSATQSKLEELHV